jgi:phosphatidylglycerophosphatase A
MKFGERSVIFIATGCFSGQIPIAPGTIGSLWGLPIAYGLSKVYFWSAACVIAAMTAFAIVISHQAESLLNQKDPGCIVIDEIVGMAVTLWGLPFDLFTVIIGFLLFRGFDIVKPFPIRFFEKRVKGGSGIVLDDVMAGICGNLVLRAILNFGSH